MLCYIYMKNISELLRCFPPASNLNADLILIPALYVTHRHEIDIHQNISPIKTEHFPTFL